MTDFLAFSTIDLMTSVSSYEKRARMAMSATWRPHEDAASSTDLLLTRGNEGDTACRYQSDVVSRRRRDGHEGSGGRPDRRWRRLVGVVDCKRRSKTRSIGLQRACDLKETRRTSLPGFHVGINEREYDERLSRDVGRGGHGGDGSKDDGDVHLVPRVSKNDDPTGRDVLGTLTGRQSAADHPVVEVDELGRGLIVVSKGLCDSGVACLRQGFDEALELRVERGSFSCTNVEWEASSLIACDVPQRRDLVARAVASAKRSPRKIA